MFRRSTLVQCYAQNIVGDHQDSRQYWACLEFPFGLARSSLEFPKDARLSYAPTRPNATRHDTMTDILPQPQFPDGNTSFQVPDSTDFPAAIHDKYTVHGLYKEVTHSTLYNATHKQTAVPVIIKSIHLERVDSWKELDLFIGQSAILKNLDHPGIPKLFDAVDDQENGCFYLVQEYIDAPSLKTVLEERGRLPVELCLDIALQLCGILEALAAFSPPVVHRDIKPSNILLDADNKVHLIDFDLATVRHTENRGSTIAGTVGYMPAEQYFGKAGTAADVYAVFATVLHLLTGTDPGKMDTEEFRLQFEPYLPPGTNPNLVRLFYDTLQPVEQQRLTSLRTIRMRIEGILGKDARSIVRSGSFGELNDLNVPIRAKSENNPDLLNLPPVPRPYRKTVLRGERDSLISKLVFSFIIALVLTFALVLFAYEMMIFPFLIGIPLAFLLIRSQIKMTRKVDKLYNAFCNWEQNTAIISDIENMDVSLLEIFLKGEGEKHRIRFFHKVEDRIYNVEQNIATLLVPKDNASGEHVETFQRRDGKVELKVGDEVSIIYNPKKPGKALIFPGPVRTYLEHPALLR